MNNDRLYFRQLLSGRDFAQTDAFAQQMVNFVYLIGDRETKEAVIVDPAYDPAGILEILEADGMTCVGMLGTHYHADHVGGSMMGLQVSGAAELLGHTNVPLHIQTDEADFVKEVTGLGDADLTLHDGSDSIDVGAIKIELLHTPGHTPGSQSFLVDNRLVAGDTLFLQGCGRTDLPGGNPAQLYDSLTKVLSKVPDDAVLFPGHQYSPEPSATMGATRAQNMVFAPTSAEQWMSMFGQ
ncbi:MAG: MBL fold metallo-hydrolase [Acidimicrobiia bacterium]|nr:MBL fold metallo-hydrolase [Acidimicrobiia bacterium]